MTFLKKTLLIALVFGLSLVSCKNEAKEAKENKDEEIYDFPERDANYPGGMEAMYTELYSKINYPIEARRNEIQGRVFVEFVISTEGEVTNVKLLKGIGGGCDEAVLEAVKSLKKWIPAEQGGGPVAQRFKLPVKFEL